MIFCFSGTGNSRYIAQRIAEALQKTVIDLNARIKANNTTTVDTGSDVIMVTPTYAWRIPKIVSEWMEKTKWTGAKRIWFVMDCGSEIGNAAKYNRSLAEQKQLHYMGTAQIIMPENYIAMFNAPQVDEAQQITAKAEPDIQAAIKCIQKKQEFPVPTIFNFGRKSRCGAEIVPIVWPVSAIVRWKPLSMARRASANQDINLKS